MIPIDLTGDEPALHARLADWLAQRIGSPVRIEAIEPLSGGLVNVIRRVTVSVLNGAESRFVLRWDPVEGPHAPYDMAAQFRLFEALATTAIPVPRPLWLESDPAVIGRTFWFSEFVVGETMGRLLSPEASPARLASYVDALAVIHGTDWRQAGLAGHAPVIAPAAIPDLIAQAAQDFTYLATVDRPVFARARDALLARAPRDFTPALTHGDCSLSNFLFRGDAVAAVVDWDLIRITDPTLDLGYYCAINDRFQMHLPRGERAARRAPVVEAYRRRSGRSLETLPFWDLFCTFYNALTWVRPGWGGTGDGFCAYRARLEELLV